MNKYLEKAASKLGTALKVGAVAGVAAAGMAGERKLRKNLKASKVAKYEATHPNED